jgi:hypothetical protein
MPQHRRHAKPRLEAAQEVLGQGDFGQQDQHLPPSFKRFGHGFEIVSVLPDPVTPSSRKGLRSRMGLEPMRRRCRPRLAGLRPTGLAAKMSGSGAGVGAVEIDRHRLQQPRARPCRANAFGNAGNSASSRIVACSPCSASIAAARCGVRRSGCLSRSGGIRSPCRRRAAPAARQRHSRDGERGEVIVRRPFDQAAQRGGQAAAPAARKVSGAACWPELRCPAAGPASQTIPNDLPRPQRREHDAARIRPPFLRERDSPGPSAELKTRQSDAVHKWRGLNCPLCSAAAAVCCAAC